MIVSRVFSGLGNQMFQYAIARSLALQNKTDVWLDTKSFTTDQLRSYSMDPFALQCKLVDDFQMPFVSKIGYDMLKLKKFQLKSYTDTIWDFNKSVCNDRSKFIYLSGYWAWPQYFDKVASVIKNDFKLKIPLETTAINWVKKASHNNSVALHIRRSDYVSDTNALNFFGLLGVSYYRAAITYISEHIADPYFLVFSDDLDWVKECLINETNIKNYSLVEDSCFTNDAQELILMSYCKHNITANSTFSWWGAWLNQHPDKIVIQPKTWYRDETAQQAYLKGILNIEGSVKL